MEDCLVDFARYLYSQIPEISGGTEEEKEVITSAGIIGLEAFAGKLNKLSTYVPEEKPEVSRRSLVERVRLRITAVASIFWHSNVVVSFLAWWIAIGSVVAFGVWVSFYFVPQLEVDSTIVSTVVGVPIITAGTIVSAIRRGQKAEHK